MDFDIIIIGGGMVGASLACALPASHFKVALVDATPLTPHEDSRLIALNYYSYCLFQNLNLWQHLAPHATPINEVHVSQRGRFGITRLTATELKFPTLGYVVPAKYINAALYDNLSHITLLRPATLKNLTQSTDCVTLDVTTPQGLKTLTGKIIIGADGTHSTVRELLNIPTKKIDYQQSALVTVTHLQRSHNNIAYERFQQQGAIAMLPLTGERAATIWTSDNSTIEELMQLSDAAFLQTLQKHFGYRLGRLTGVGKRATYPLQFIQAEEVVNNRVFLLGNAAHTMLPIAAQGLNLALYEIATLIDYFSQNSLDQPFSADKHWNFSQQKISMRLSHHLSWLFATDFFVMNTARQLGMLGFDLCSALKERFARKTIGRSGLAPSLLREQETHETNCT